MGFRNTRNNAADKNSKNRVIKITYIKTTNECIFLLMDMHRVNLIQGHFSITVLFNLMPFSYRHELKIYLRIQFVCMPMKDADSKSNKMSCISTKNKHLLWGIVNFNRSCPSH